MRWIPSNFLRSLHDRLNRSPASAPVNEQTALGHIREAMLDCLDGAGANSHPMVERKLIYANNLQDLWYLRGDVMAVIAAVDGEAAARNKIARISDMFKGLLPKGLVSRPSPLGH